MLFDDLFQYRTFTGDVYYSYVKLTIPANDTIYTLGQTPSDKIILMQDRTVTATSSNQDINIEINLYEGSDVTGNGTEIPIFNRNRNKAENNLFLNRDIGDGTVITSLGTDIGRGNTLRGARNTVASGGDREPYELKFSENYVLSLENKTPNPIDVELRWAWLETIEILKT